MPAFRSLHRRLALLVAIGSLAFAVLAGLVSFVLEYRAQRAMVAELQDQLVATVKASAAIAVFVGDRTIAREVVEGLLANSVVAGVRLESINGFVEEGSRPQRTSADDETVSYPLTSPVDHSDRIGVLQVRRNAREINQRAIDDAIHTAVPLILQIFLSSILLMALFRQVVGRPLTRFAQTLEKVPPGSPTRLPVPVGHEADEVGILVRSSNALLGAVQKAIEDERRLQAEVDEMQSHYRRIFETTNVGIMILRPSGRLLNCNPTLMSKIVGVSFDTKDKDDCQNFLDLVFVDSEQAWKLVMDAWESGQSAGRDLQLRQEGGPERWAHVVISVSVDSAGEIELIEGVVYDVTNRRKRELEAIRSAERDVLTGLGNRAAMEKWMAAQLRRAEHEGGGFGLMLIDLDGFKAVNDTHGHGAGDLVLQTVASRLSKQIRQGTDFAARLGGDEFTVIIQDRNADQQVLGAIAQKILSAIREPITLENAVTVQVGGSIGISRFPADGATRKDLVDAADEAMYAVKRRGKNAYAFHGESTAPLQGG